MAKAGIQQQYGLFINGEFVPASDGAAFDAHNPANGEHLAYFAEATKEDVDAAVKAARAALPEWSKTSPIERQNILLKIADIIDANLDHLALVETLDNGKPIRETTAADLLSDRAFGGADTLATAYTLAKGAEKIGDYDLLLFGRHAVDGDTAQTGPATAAFLGIPQVTLASSIDVKDGWVYCDRVLEDSTEKVRAKLPALVTVTAEINTPRYPTPINIMKALKKPRAVWNAQDLGADTAQTGIPGSPSSTKVVFEPPKRNTDTTYFTGSAEEIAAKFVDVLETEHLV